MFIGSFLVLKMITLSGQGKDNYLSHFTNKNIPQPVSASIEHFTDPQCMSFRIVCYTVMHVDPDICLSFHDLNPTCLVASAPASIPPPHISHSNHDVVLTVDLKLLCSWLLCG